MVALAAPSQESQTGGSMPVQVVEGHLVVSCDLSTASNRIPVNLFIEFEGAHGLQLHNRAAAGLRAESAAGKSAPITMHFPDFSVTVPKRELGDEDLFEEFTKYNSQEIGENALVGSIGSEVFAKWHVTFDLPNGQVRLSPPSGESGEGIHSVQTLADGSTLVPITLINGRVWLPVRRPDGTPGAMMLGTGTYDSIVERDWAGGLGKASGDVGPVKLGATDLHSFVALRPEPLVEVHPDGVVGKIGLNLLEYLEVQVDRVARTAQVRVIEPPNFPEGDRQYFRARALEDSVAVEAFLQAHPKSRLSLEASKLLLDLLIDEGADVPAIQAAVQWQADATKKDLRTTRMLDLMEEMSDAGQTEVVLAAGKLGVDGGRDDRYPNAVHSVHGLLGRTYLKRFEDDGSASEDTWRHLLSAAFGLPEDGPINLDLGRFYEKQGRYNRAFSRYIQAVIQPESGPQALEALQRVQPKLESGEAFSVDTIERMIAGKVRNFGAATRFEPSDKEPSNRIALVEFFTNCHQGTERGGAIGGALGNEGLIQHFSPDEVVFLSYHLPQPQVDPLVTKVAAARAKQLGLERPGVHVIDGLSGQPGAGKWRDAEAIYQRVRGAVIERLREFSDFDMEMESKLEQVDGEWQLSGFVDAYGYEEDGLRVQVLLVEAGVLAPGKSTVVVHRAVVRGVLSGKELGVPFELDGEGMRIDFSQSLLQVSAQNQAYLDELESSGEGSTVRISGNLDPRQVRVVAYLYDESSGEVHWAQQSTPTLPEGWQ